MSALVGLEDDPPLDREEEPEDFAPLCANAPPVKKKQRITDRIRFLFIVFLLVKSEFGFRQPSQFANKRSANLKLRLRANNISIKMTGEITLLPVKSDFSSGISSRRLDRVTWQSRLEKLRSSQMTGE